MSSTSLITRDYCPFLRKKKARHTVGRGGCLFLGQAALSGMRRTGFFVDSGAGTGHIFRPDVGEHRQSGRFATGARPSRFKRSPTVHARAPQTRARPH